MLSWFLPVHLLMLSVRNINSQQQSDEINNHEDGALPRSYIWKFVPVWFALLQYS